MLIRTSSTGATLGNRLRFAILAIFGMVAGHDAVYAAGHGLGDGYRMAMTGLGHDPYWIPVSVAALLATALVLLGRLSSIVRLQRRLSTGRRSSDDGGPSYRSTVLGIWPRLFALVVLGFVVQENLEQLRSAGAVGGIDVLFSTTPLAIAVLALVTLVLAAVGALVRWRIEHLRHRLATLGTSAPHGLDPISASPRWRLVDIAAIAWLIDRCDAGRAPPMPA